MRRERKREIYLRSGIFTLVFRLYVEMMVETGGFKFWNVVSINCLSRNRRIIGKRKIIEASRRIFPSSRRRRNVPPMIIITSLLLNLLSEK